MDYTLTLQQPFDHILQTLMDRLQQHNLGSQVSFNACLEQNGGAGSCSPCGQQRGACRYAVLLVYPQGRPEFRTITIYGQDETAWLTLVWQPALTEPEADQALEILLVGILASLAQSF